MAFLLIVKDAGSRRPSVLCQLRYDWIKYGVPGGGRKKGETQKACAARECHEESGVWVKDMSKVYQLSSNGNYWVTTWENCDVGKCSHPGEAKPFKKWIPDSEGGPNNHRWLTREQLNENKHHFAWRNGEMALRALNYDFGVDETPASKRPKVDIGDIGKLLELAKHAGKNDRETWKAILTQLPSENIDERGSHTFTLLHHAAEQGQIEAVQLLLDLGADPHLKVKGKNRTAIDLAKREGHSDVVRLLSGHVAKH